MAFVVRRPRGRWEIRESYSTGRGPRSRTLAGFTVLTPDVIRKAERAAGRGLERADIVRSARRAGARIASDQAEEKAVALIREVARGRSLRPGLRQLLRDALDGPKTRSVDPALALWIGASYEERAAALVDLLGVGDRLPKPPRRPLEFPGLRPRRRKR